MKALSYSEVESHDVFEFSYNRNYGKHWCGDSVYLASDDMLFIEKYINLVMPDFNYNGPNKVTDEQWERVRALSPLNNDEIQSFFDSVQLWRKNDPQGRGLFWILGV